MTVSVRLTLLALLPLLPLCDVEKGDTSPRFIRPGVRSPIFETTCFFMSLVQKRVRAETASSQDAETEHFVGSCKQRAKYALFLRSIHFFFYDRSSRLIHNSESGGWSCA